MSDLQQAQPNTSDGVTAGTMLRRAREAAGMHVAALAVALKVPVAKLEALEDDRYELMPDLVFVRALASSICRILHVDAEPVLSRLPQTSARRHLGDINGINAPFRAPNDVAPAGWRAYFKRPVFLTVFALLAGTLVLMVLPNTGTFDKVVGKPVIGADAASDGPQSVSMQTTSVPSLVSGLAPSASPADPVAGVAANGSAVATPALEAVASVPASTTSPPAVSAVPVATTVPSDSVAALVVVRARGESWVEITDAKGAVAVRKVLNSGEAATAEGALPLNVTIGRADAIDVQVRGKPFDLRSVSRDNVARFVVR